MKKYILYIIVTLVILVGLIYYMAVARKDSSPVVQSHRSYSMQLTSDSENIQPGKVAKISYKIVNDKNEVLKDYTVAHEKIMHLILVRKDLQNFQHLHPDFNKSTGEFSLNVTFLEDGPYRIFPDFTPTPENPQKLTVTVYADLNVGDESKYISRTVTVDTSAVKSVDGYEVNYDLPEMFMAKTQLDYSLVVEKSGKSVTLEPYLGAMGHGVIIKEGSLDFIHTHAVGMGSEGMSGKEHILHEGEPGTIDFSTTLPEPGVYKIFTQFQLSGKVITTEYTIKAY